TTTPLADLSVVSRVAHPAPCCVCRTTGIESVSGPVGTGRCSFRMTAGSTTRGRTLISIIFAQEDPPPRIHGLNLHSPTLVWGNRANTKRRSVNTHRVRTHSMKTEHPGTLFSYPTLVWGNRANTKRHSVNTHRVRTHRRET